MSSSEFNRRRNKKFRQCVLRQYNSDPFLRKLYNSYGIFESDLPKTIECIDKLPTMNRNFIAEAQYHENLIIPRENFFQAVYTSGSTGEPICIPWSKNALKRLYADLFIRSMYFSGVNPLETSYWITHYTPKEDKWISHLSAKFTKKYYLKKRGIDESTTNPPEHHLKRIKKIKPHCVLTGPNYLMQLASISKGEVHIPKMMVGGQYFDEEMREYIENTFNGDVIGFYPSTELGIPAVECPEKRGYHIWTDEYEIEILDENNERVSEGERGNVVVTAFSMDGASMIRYEIGDEATYFSGCTCCRPFPSIIHNIRRAKMIPIGDGRIPYSHIENIASTLRKEGIPLLAIQASKRREQDKKERLILRLEVENPIEIEKKVKELLLNTEHLKYLVEAKEVHEPEIEIYKQGELTKGKIKIPIYSEI